MCVYFYGTKMIWRKNKTRMFKINVLSIHFLDIYSSLHINSIYNAKVIFTVTFNIRKNPHALTDYRAPKIQMVTKIFVTYPNSPPIMTILFTFGNHLHLKIVFRNIDAPKNRVIKSVQGCLKFSFYSTHSKIQVSIRKALSILWISDYELYFFPLFSPFAC